MKKTIFQVTDIAWGVWNIFGASAQERSILIYFILYKILDDSTEIESLVH